MDESIDEPVASGDVPSNTGAGALTTAEIVLLQQHRSLLSQRVTSQIAFRIIAALLVGITLTALGPTDSGYVSFAVLIVATAVMSLWSVEQRLFGERIVHLEKLLSRKSPLAFQQIYIDYKFDSGMSATRWRSLRSEPLVWLVIILLNVLLRRAL